MSAKPTLRPKRFLFGVGLRWTGGKEGVAAVTGKPDLRISTPPEFKGPPGLWSPEDLFVSAANTCLMTTFLALAEREHLDVASYDSAAEGVVEFIDGKLRFTSLRLMPKITVAAADVERAAILIEKAEGGCLVSASLATPVRLEPQIVPIPSVADAAALQPASQT